MIKSSRAYTVVILAIAFTITAFTTIYFSINGTGEDAMRLMIRWTSKFSAFLFSVAFGISSVHSLLKNDLTATILKFRPHIGLSFGVFHTFHLIFLIWLQQEIHPVFTLAKHSSLIGGGMAYVFMFLMMITTFPKMKKIITPGQWRFLHLIGGYWIWVIFFRTYLKQILHQDRGYFLFVLLLLVMLSRLAFILFRRNKIQPI